MPSAVSAPRSTGALSALGAHACLGERRRQIVVALAGGGNRIVAGAAVNLAADFDADVAAVAAVAEQLRLKMTPGVQPGELPGSLHDALMKLVPNMKMNASSMKPGASDPEMMNMMLEGWRRRTSALPDVPPIGMSAEPKLSPKSCSGQGAVAGREVAP